MDKIIVTSIYTDIIDYYHYFEPETIKDGEDDVIAFRREPYRDFISLEAWETERETLRNYLSKYFRYLMTNVFCLELKNYKAKGSKGSFFIYEKDAPIFYEILLRSISQNKHDLIIGKWLNGKIKHNDYYSITDLSTQLFTVIKNNKEAAEDVKNQWIEALSIALQTDLAYTMTEVEFTINEIFRRSLPFKVNDAGSNKNNKMCYSNICHSYFKDSIVAELDTNDMTAQNSILSIVCEYLKTADFAKMREIESFPPVELLKMKNVCEVLLPLERLDKILPNADMVNEYSNYFASIDKDYLNKIAQRKENDKERHRRKKETQKAVKEPG